MDQRNNGRLDADHGIHCYYEECPLMLNRENEPVNNRWPTDVTVWLRPLTWRNSGG